MKPNFVEINYEDFVLKPKEELLKLFEFLQLDASEKLVDDYFNKNQIYGSNKNDKEYFPKATLNEIQNMLNTII